MASRVSENYLFGQDEMYLDLMSNSVVIGISGVRAIKIKVT